MGFYASCTFIDHQIRLILGTLREEGILDDTVILFTSDHGDMLGDHRLWAKSLFFEASAGIPMILVDRKGGGRIESGREDGRLCGHEDIMPTLLELCEIPVPDTVEGRSLIGENHRNSYYGEHFEDFRAMRMLRRGDAKLIWYPAGNRRQLFDLATDPREEMDLSGNPDFEDLRKELEGHLVRELYGGDTEWIENGRLVGTAEGGFDFEPDRGLGAQRGWRF
jgi:arylsulfatase A-like enzyme